MFTPIFFALSLVLSPADIFMAVAYVAEFTNSKATLGILPSNISHHH